MSNDKFSELRRIYGQSSNLEQISNKSEDVLFLKIRSLKKKNLQELCLKKLIIKENDEKKLNEWELREIVFKNFNHKEINDFIKKNFESEFSEEEIEIISKELENVEEHAPTVFLDSFDSVLKRTVRNKKIMHLLELRKNIKENLITRLGSYVEWSWFNQKSNDLIEEIFNEHTKILPTIRKVRGVDFFINLKEQSIPVDLKLTFLPKEFSSIYIKNKKMDHKQILEMVKKNPKILADWLYENQNPRLFNNNKRLFIILVDHDNIGDSWKLKADYKLIKSRVNSFLDSLNEKDGINVGYDYTKDERVRGKYKTDCFLLIIEK